MSAFHVFIDKANNEIRRASSDYLFFREVEKDPEAALQKANEKVYKAIQDRNFFEEMQQRIDDENEL